MATTIDTGKVANRRTLRFDTIAQLLAELDRIEAADRAGSLRNLGNWTTGQVLGHVAAWIDYGYDGFPLGPPPFFIRWILRWRRNSYLKNGLPSGVKIPSVEGGTFGMEPLSTAEGIAKLRRSLARLASSEPVKYHSPAFGPMSDEDRAQFMLRHAELHLGFLTY